MSDDNTILVTKDRSAAQGLAKVVREEFRSLRPWICVICDSGEFRVTIDGPWGNRLPKDEESKIKTFAKKFGKSTVSSKPSVSEKN